MQGLMVASMTKTLTEQGPMYKQQLTEREALSLFINSSTERHQATWEQMKKARIFQIETNTCSLPKKSGSLASCCAAMTACMIVRAVFSKQSVARQQTLPVKYSIVLS